MSHRHGNSCLTKFENKQVIVGANGAGKSTILKLTTRLYDPDEGEILFGGHDIRTLKLDDLRRAISVLFQDYTLFPLSVRPPPSLPSPTPFRSLTRRWVTDTRQHRPRGPHCHPLRLTSGGLGPGGAGGAARGGGGCEAGPASHTISDIVRHHPRVPLVLIVTSVLYFVSYHTRSQIHSLPLWNTQF